MKAVENAVTLLLSMVCVVFRAIGLTLLRQLVALLLYTTTLP
ncbi:unnamed protein product [Larinioides sclopetarius]|uniref:Uncharacterized protein n=1 Tax=Larinioides sclopetarius TaxID=280406 RepID=A0AAV1Z703_9ARAC